MSARPAAVRNGDRRLVIVLLIGASLLGIAGVDLVLPGVPALPAALGGTPAQAQFVLAAYVTGTAIGLLAFGELGARYARRTLLTASLGLFAVASLAAAAAPDMGWLIGLRVVEGAAGAAPAVFAPGLIRALYGDVRAVTLIGRMGSIQALTPALAPIAGVWLLAVGGWRCSFLVLAGFATLAAALTAMLMPARLAEPAAPPGAPRGSYGRLLGSKLFLRDALSQALSLGSLLTFVFGAPAVFVGPLGQPMSTFIVMQVIGIANFIAASMMSGWLSARFGAERVVFGGTLLLAAAFLAILADSLAGDADLHVVIGLFAVVNLGFGIRGPTGFHRAIVASGGDDARGSALVVLGLLLAGGAGTAAVAPFIGLGLVPLAAGGAVLAVAAVLVLALIPPARW